MDIRIKLDGYRAITVKAAGRVRLWSRNEKDFGRRYTAIAAALDKLPDESVVDGEIVALDASGRPSFNALQNYGSAPANLIYYLFDVPLLGGRDLRGETLDVRRNMLEGKVLPRLAELIRASAVLPGRLDDLIRAVKEQGLEGLVAKRRESRFGTSHSAAVWEPNAQRADFCSAPVAAFEQGSESEASQVIAFIGFMMTAPGDFSISGPLFFLQGA